MGSLLHGEAPPILVPGGGMYFPAHVQDAGCVRQQVVSPSHLSRTLPTADVLLQEKQPTLCGCFYDLQKSIAVGPSPFSRFGSLTGTCCCWKLYAHHASHVEQQQHCHRRTQNMSAHPSSRGVCECFLFSLCLSLSPDLSDGCVYISNGCVQLLTAWREKEIHLV